MKPTKTERKVATIAKILENPVYLPESKLYQGLQKTLNRMSVSDLTNLSIIIGCKSFPDNT